MIVVDTNIFIAALRSKAGASHVILREILTGDIIAGASVALFLEYEDVLKRKEHLKVCKLTVEDVNIVLSALAKRLVPIHTYYQWRPVLQDPKDEMVLEAAVNAGVNTIVTFNLKDFKGAEALGVSTMLPGEYVRRMKS